MTPELELWFKKEVALCVTEIDKQWEAYKKVLKEAGGSPPIVTPDTIFPHLLRLMSIAKEMQGRWDAENDF